MSSSKSPDELFLETVASALEKTGLEAIVVGNTASILHGAPVTTDDVDLLIRDTPRNRQKLLAFAEAIDGTRPQKISDLSSTERIYADVQVDILFNRIGGTMRFESVRSRSSKMRVGRGTVTVASLEDVVRSKEAAGREKDHAVLPILRNTLRTLRSMKEEE